MTELTPLGCYSPHVKADTPDPRLHVLARRLPDWPTDDLADLLAALDAAEAAVQRVRELHQPCDNDRNRTPICEHCHGKAGTHPCGCWAPTDRQPVCAVCNEGDKGIRVEWPCPTERALNPEVTL